ncbi:unnamed protein product [Calypogeia fissa]
MTQRGLLQDDGYQRPAPGGGDTKIGRP